MPLNTARATEQSGGIGDCPGRSTPRQTRNGRFGVAGRPRSRKRVRRLNKSSDRIPVLTPIPWPRIPNRIPDVAAELSASGRPMQQVDIMIAAIACSLGNCSVVTADSDLI